MSFERAGDDLLERVVNFLQVCAVTKIARTKRAPGSKVVEIAFSDSGAKPKSPTNLPESIVIEAADGCRLQAFLWHQAAGDRETAPVVIINPATSVACRYYFRFADYLFENGFTVIAYDYRGIGGSRPATLRDFDACWIDWGRLDFDAVLQHAAQSFPGRQIHVVAHSVGGFVLGLAKSNHLISRVFTVGAQYAYWRDYAAGTKFRMIARWHVLMPLITVFYGYFPGKKLGWLEDTPKGIVRDWVFSRKRFEDTWRGRSSARYANKQELVDQFAEVTAPTLAISVTDDEFGTIPAIERLLAYFKRSSTKHLRISPHSIGELRIGHFGFFNSKYQRKLWQLPVEWLRSERLPSEFTGQIVSDRPPMSGPKRQHE